MELAALQTRRTKRDVKRDALFQVWRADARGRGFKLNRDAAREPSPPMMNSPAARTSDRQEVATPASLIAGPQSPDWFALKASKVTRALKAMNQPGAMPGLEMDLRQRDWELDRR
jgi:hypothetical protein